MQNIRIAMNRGALSSLPSHQFPGPRITINRTLDEILALKRSLQDRAQLNALQQELNIAAQIQQSILPRCFPLSLSEPSLTSSPP